jgi:RimJ/RimL family protein N-acetyltransferase
LEVIEGWRLDWAAGRRAPFAVRHAASGDTVGSVELHLDDSDEWSISYLTHPAWRGRGIATRAVRLACGWAFATLGTDRVLLSAAEDNAASRWLARNVGFVDTGQRTKSEPIVSFGPEAGVTRTIILHVLTDPEQQIPSDNTPNL